MNYLPKIRWWLLVLLIVLAPFHAFLITWLKSAAPDFGFLTIVSAWREIVILLIGLIVVVESALKKHLRLDILDWLIIVYAMLSVKFLPSQWENKTQWLLGFRFDILPLVFLIIVRRVEWPNIKMLLKITLVVAAVVAVFGLLQSTVLPRDFLMKFGYSNSVAEYQPGVAIASCQYLEASDKVCRATSTFGGPTRYGTYLLLIAGLLVPLLISKKNWSLRYWSLLAVVLANIALTYSRSIWLGAAAMGVFAFFWFIPNKAKLKISFAVLLVAIAAAAGVWIYGLQQAKFEGWPPPFLRVLFVRDVSTSAHFNPMGMGLGTVGPASVRFQKLLTENWFLQIADEMGVIGLLIFLGILFFISKKLLADKTNLRKVGLFLGLLGICVAGLFTHSFEETTTALLLFGFVGIGIKNMK
jgi:preprotein translocase subunit SecE